jgi:hypothetical protein
VADESSSRDPFLTPVQKRKALSFDTDSARPPVCAKSAVTSRPIGRPFGDGERGVRVSRARSERNRGVVKSDCERGRLVGLAALPIAMSSLPAAKPADDVGICSAGFLAADVEAPRPIGASQLKSFNWPMSALGQKRTLPNVSAMSALPPKADIGTEPRNVRFVPKADSCTQH